jgi:hypothetical protein
MLFLFSLSFAQKFITIFDVSAEIGITHGDCNMLTVQATAEVAQW